MGQGGRPGGGASRAAAGSGRTWPRSELEELGLRRAAGARALLVGRATLPFIKEAAGAAGETFNSRPALAGRGPDPRRGHAATPPGRAAGFAALPSLRDELRRVAGGRAEQAQRRARRAAAVRGQVYAIDGGLGPDLRWSPWSACRGSGSPGGCSGSPEKGKEAAVTRALALALGGPGCIRLLCRRPLRRWAAKARHGIDARGATGCAAPAPSDAAGRRVGPSTVRTVGPASARSDRVARRRQGPRPARRHLWTLHGPRAGAHPAAGRGRW